MPRRPAEPAMRSQLVRPFLLAVRSAGGEPDTLIERFGLPVEVLEAPEVTLPLGRLDVLLAAAADAAGDPFLGAHVAMGLDRGTYGVVEFACRSAPTLREAMRRIVRYISLLNEVVVVTFEEGDGTGVVQQSIPGWPGCLGRQANEFFVALLLHHARQLSGEACVPEQVWLAHHRPARVDELERVFGTTRLEFGAGRNGVALPRLALDAPLVTADPHLLSILDRHAEVELASRTAPSRFLGRVRSWVQARLPGGVPTLVETAAALRMSPRTFQRRLAEEGTSWQGLIDDVREELARARVMECALPLGEIAYLCGYAELSAFLRAFRRWTGQTPSELRGAR